MIKIFTTREKDRKTYHNAWKFMYFFDKNLYKAKIFDEVNPLANKPLGTETEVWCAIAYDTSILSWSKDKIEQFKKDHELAFIKSDINIMERGIPVGVQSWVVTKTKIIGKQMIVAKGYEGKGICSAMLVESGRHLKGVKKANGDLFEEAYIGCSQYSKPIFEKKFGLEPFSSSEEHDLYKFNVPMEKLTDNKLHKKLVKNRGIKTY